VEPVGEVHEGKGWVAGWSVGGLEWWSGDGQGGERLEDGAVGEAVVEHSIDEVSGGFGEAGDFAVTGSLFPTVEIGESAEEAGGLASTSSGDGGAVGRWTHGLVDWWIYVGWHNGPLLVGGSDRVG
jgi:hypothetical protein